MKKGFSVSLATRITILKGIWTNKCSTRKKMREQNEQLNRNCLRGTKGYLGKC